MTTPRIRYGGFELTPHEVDLMAHLWDEPIAADNEYIRHARSFLITHSTARSWHDSFIRTRSTPSTLEPTQALRDIERRLSECEEGIDTAIDIGLRNLKQLEELRGAIDNQTGLCAIHSLNDGQIQLSSPIFASFERIDDEVVASIEEFGVYGVGSTEGEALREIQEELWNLFESLSEVSAERLGTDLANTLRALKARIQLNAGDA